MPRVRRAEDALTPRQAALWAIVASERRMIVERVSRRVLPHAVEDTVQTVLERAARLILRDRLVIAQEVDARPIVRAWLTSILRRVCTETRRVEVAAKRTREELAAEDRASIDPMRRIVAREELAQVPRGLRAVDLETLDAFVRHGGNYTETAAELRIPIGSLSTRITEIRRYLRKRRDLDK